jgi:hypothetical protein
MRRLVRVGGNDVRFIREDFLAGGAKPVAISGFSAVIVIAMGLPSSLVTVVDLRSPSDRPRPVSRAASGGRRGIGAR